MPGASSPMGELFLLRIDSLLCSICDAVQLVPIHFEIWVMAEWLRRRTQEWTHKILSPAFETGLRLVEQFAISWNLPCCQCTETCSHVFSIQNNSLQWRHNGRYSVSNHQPHGCFSIVYSNADQRKHQSSASLAFVRGIHRGPVNSPHKWPVTRKMFPFDYVIIF